MSPSLTRLHQMQSSIACGGRGRNNTLNLDHVMKWRAWNDNAVLNLAFAIRDHGQTDAFPILADASKKPAAPTPICSTRVASVTPTSTGPG